MALQNELHEIIAKIEKLESSETLKSEAALPSGSYFLDSDTVCCYPRDFGDSRYPYGCGGFTLWAHSSGMITVNESAFYVILPAAGGKEPYASFFAGIKNIDGTFTPIPLQEVNKQPLENNCKRYCVYTAKAVYYITRTPRVTAALRAFVTEKKEVHFSLLAENNTTEPQELYLSSYINCLLKHCASENVETNWFRGSKACPGGFVFESVEDLSRTTHIEHYASLARTAGEFFKSLDVTAARAVFTGSSVCPVACSKPLFTGSFAKKKENCKFTDTAVAGDIITYAVPPGGACRADYSLNVFSSRIQAETAVKKASEAFAVDKKLSALMDADRKKFESADMLKISFGKHIDAKIKPYVFNSFIKNVIRQVEFCALAKNSGVSLLGIRDVFQQIEAALIWNPADCRAKIIEALGFTDISGRPPRQYSMPARDGGIPEMDLRAFIDQGVWIINTVYSYLSYTGDFSILNEICGYYKFCEGNRVETTDLKENVFQHLVRITDYLLQNLDYEQTGCLKVIYGDWNDALDGMGTTAEPGKQYGTGVSVMASLQFYQNLSEMKEIAAAYGSEPGLADRYENARALIKQGLNKHAVVRNGEGETKILHGWGDKKSYLVGSFADTDGASRDSLTSNSFWVISGAYEWDASIKDAVLAAFDRLDSKYGLKTFEPYFPAGMKGVGRIINLPPGTAENAAAYAHASLFGVWALFKLGESERAWRQLEKILPFTHDALSCTPFVMSNSYSLNEEYGMDGESMSDWFTGSSNVLIKVIVRCVFGINVTLGETVIKPSGYFPFSTGEISLKIGGANVNIIYKNENKGKREILFNNTPVDGMDIRLRRDEMKGNINIKISD